MLNISGSQTLGSNCKFLGSYPFNRINIAKLCNANGRQLLTH